MKVQSRRADTQLSESSQTGDNSGRNTSVVLRNASRVLGSLALAGCAAHGAQRMPPEPHRRRACEEATHVTRAPLPKGFAYLQDHIPGLLVDLRYAGPDNFLGRPVPGYCGERAIATVAAMQALQRVQARAKALNLGLLVYDAYRPQHAVDAFVAWAADPADVAGKAEYYPSLEKDRIFAEGYIAARSGHSRGSTIDLTLVSLPDGAPLDMGSPFDLFDVRSHTDAEALAPEARRNRDLLRELMRLEGFVNLPQEWWHFTLQNEPYPDTYFDFPIR